MKQLFQNLAILSLLAVVLYSCSPTVTTPETPNSLNTLKTKTGTLTFTSGNTNTYSLGLQCGCPFTMKVEKADTLHISYNITDLGDTISVHTVTAAGKNGFAKGTYIDSVVLITIPPTVETFRDTLRDTLIVP